MDFQGSGPFFELLSSCTLTLGYMTQRGEHNRAEQLALFEFLHYFGKHRRALLTLACRYYHPTVLVDIIIKKYLDSKLKITNKGLRVKLIFGWMKDEDILRLYELFKRNLPLERIEYQFGISKDDKKEKRSFLFLFYNFISHCIFDTQNSQAFVK